MSNALRSAKSRDNLSRAWRWTRTNKEQKYRRYCEHIWRACSLAVDSRLDSIRAGLLNGTYQPEHATKLFLPKASGIQRPYTLLTVGDQIVYQAFANVIAERLVTKQKARYNRTVFGHLYGGKESLFFYRDWKHSYRLFTNGMRAAFANGYEYTASFDLTACYDSIDHSVIEHSLKDLKLDQDFINEFLRYLAHWTEYTGGIKHLYHGHGIPQGPLPSGLIAETVLRYFDDADGRSDIRYFRYVDDIRLFAKEERSLRRELVALDVRSKELGLFPQSSKIHIHRVVDIEEEFKSISLPQGHAGASPPKSAAAITGELLQLSAHYKVKNGTRFKFLLALAPATNTLAQRLIEIVERDPALYENAFGYIGRIPRLTAKTSTAVMELLPLHDVYPAFAASLLRAVRYNLHRSERAAVHRYARAAAIGRRKASNPELLAAAYALLAEDGKLSYAEMLEATTESASWWTRASILPAITDSAIGRPSYQALIQAALCDPVADVSLVAAEKCVIGRLAPPVPLSKVHDAGQEVLRAARLIGRRARRRCVIAPLVATVIGPQMASCDWQRVLDAQTYHRVSTRFAVWRGYADTDVTAWVALTDTVNDILLSCLFPHDGTIGGYAIGTIGGVVRSSTSRFAKKYPLLWKACSVLHDLRLQSDITHPVVRTNGKPTRRIFFREKPALVKALGAGWTELHAKW
jgi:retron-type reverse transcriptase